MRLSATLRAMPMTFKELLNKLVECAVVAQEAAEAQAQERMEDLYEERDGVLHPKTTRLHVNGNTIDVPKASLRQLSSMKMREIRLQLETDVDFEDADATELRVGLKKKLFKNNSHLKIEVVFEAQEAAEGAKLIQDSSNARLRKQIGDY